ncbi:hypothetical protein [Rhizobium leguminosarum]|uniref:Putative integral membrane protein n=1 Tax=Rhizobium leguminosarum TaxID=384 RepID=A0A2Z4YVU2_RHILE|nr:hypothetical protein [Rhizobium leguminosarum]AXA44233.1 putative integral membrane protein [Rhizobium leguminosarum]
MNIWRSRTELLGRFSQRTGSATDSMPSDLFGFIWLMGRRHQALIAGLSLVLFAIGAAPLELQRRIVNEATQQASYGSLLFLVSLYLAVAVVEGAIKFTLNLYRSWVGERGTLWLRARVLHQAETPPSESMLEGVELSIVLAEAEPVGGFVGTSISEPLLVVRRGLLLRLKCRPSADLRRAENPAGKVRIRLPATSWKLLRIWAGWRLRARACLLLPIADRSRPTVCGHSRPMPVRDPRS